MLSLIIQVLYNNPSVLFYETHEAINTADICPNPIDFISPKTGIIRLHELGRSARTESNDKRCCSSLMSQMSLDESESECPDKSHEHDFSSNKSSQKL